MRGEARIGDYMINFCITGMMTTGASYLDYAKSFFNNTPELPKPVYVKTAPVEPPADAVWLVSIEYRKREQPGTLGPFKTKERAVQAVRDHLDHWSEEEINSYTECGSDINEGCIYTEEETIETFWRVLE